MKGLLAGPVRVLNIGLNGILITERETSRRFFRHVSPSLKNRPLPPITLSRSNAMPLG